MTLPQRHLPLSPPPSLPVPIQPYHPLTSHSMFMTLFASHLSHCCTPSAPNRPGTWEVLGKYLLHGPASVSPPVKWEGSSPFSLRILLLSCALLPSQLPRPQNVRESVSSKLPFTHREGVCMIVLLRSFLCRHKLTNQEVPLDV